MPDPTSHIHLGSIFPKKAWIILCKTWIWDLDRLVRVWPYASGLEASWCTGIIWPGFWQNATSPLPVSHFQTWFCSSTDIPDNIVQTQPRSNLVLADCVRFWPNGSGPEVSQCARIIQPASGQCFPADLDQMQIRSGMFTGCLGNETQVVLVPNLTIIEKEGN